MSSESPANTVGSSTGPGGRAVWTPDVASGAVRRGGLVTVLAAVIGLIVGALLTLVLPKTYTAQASVLVTDTGVQSGSTSISTARSGSSDINPDTEAQLAKSTAVALLARGLDPNLRSSSADSLASRVSVTVPSNTPVLRIAFEAKTARLAQAGAQAFADGYLAERQDAAQSIINAQITKQQNSVNNLTTQSESLLKRITPLQQGSAQRQQLVTARSLLLDQISSFTRSILSERAQTITPGRVLVPAALPGSPSSPKLVLWGASGFAVGLLVGLAIAWYQLRIRRRIRTAADLAAAVDVPALADIKQLDATELLPASGAATEAVRRLATVTSASVMPPATVVVSTVRESAAAGAVAAALCTSLSRSGWPVAMLRIGDDRPATAVPADVTVTSISRIDELPGARGTHSREALVALRGDSQLLIVDVPGSSVTADAQAVAAASDAVLLVVESGTPASELIASLQDFDRVSAPMLGSVMVRALSKPAATKSSGAKGGAAGAVTGSRVPAQVGGAAQAGGAGSDSGAPSGSSPSVSGASEHATAPSDHRDDGTSFAGPSTTADRTTAPTAPTATTAPAATTPHTETAETTETTGTTGTTETTETPAAQSAVDESEAQPEKVGASNGSAPARTGQTNRRVGRDRRPQSGHRG